MSQKFPRRLDEAGGGAKETAVAAGGSGPYDPNMEARVAVLETHMEYVRADLAEIKAEQKMTSAAIASLAAATERLSAKVEAFDAKVDARLEASDLKLSRLVEASELKLSAQMAALPTKTDLRNYNLQHLAIGFAFLVLVVGGIVGGLDWIKVH